MKHQNTRYWCGIASIANALECLGIRKTQREIAKLCAVSPSAGTDETEMKRALLACGCTHLDEVAWSVADQVEAKEAYWWLRAVLSGGPAILCVDNDEHWVTAIGAVGARIVIFDPSRNHGVMVYEWSELLDRWINNDNICYGIGI